MDPPPSLRPGGATRQPQSNYTTSDRDWRRDDPRERQRDDKQYYDSNGRGVRPNRSQNRDARDARDERDRSRGGDAMKPKNRDRSRQNGVRAGTRRLDGRWSIPRGRGDLNGVTVGGEIEGMEELIWGQWGGWSRYFTCN